MISSRRKFSKLRNVVNDNLVMNDVAVVDVVMIDMVVDTIDDHVRFGTFHRQDFDHQPREISL